MIGLMMAAALLAPVAPAAPAGPPPFCITEYDLMKVGNSVRAYGYRTCDDGIPIPLSVSLQRLNSTGAWPVVATGIGEAQFNCFGTGLRTYRNSKAPSVTLKANCT